MTVPAKIASDVQKSATDAWTELFTLDLSPLRGGYRYFTAATTEAGGQVYYGGQAYEALPLATRNFKLSSKETSEPEIEVSNIQGTLAADMAAYKNFIGAKLTRKRTFRKYLDDGSAPDSAAYVRDKWIVNYIKNRDKQSITWALRSPLTQKIMIPKRLVVRDTCTLVYRYYYNGDFVYVAPADGGCPYAGASYWKQDGTPTENPAEDQCGFKVEDCELRFPTGYSQASVTIDQTYSDDEAFETPVFYPAAHTRRLWVICKSAGYKYLSEDQTYHQMKRTIRLNWLLSGEATWRSKDWTVFPSAPTIGWVQSNLDTGEMMADITAFSATYVPLQNWYTAECPAPSLPNLYNINMQYYTERIEDDVLDLALPFTGFKGIEL